MRKRQTYKHASALDTGLYIFYVRTLKDGNMRVRAALHNLQFGYVYEVETYIIKRDQLINWRRQ